MYTNTPVIHLIYLIYESILDLCEGPMVKIPPANAGDTGFIPGPGRFHTPWDTSAHMP